MKPALFVLLSICAGVSVALAQTAPLPIPIAPRPVRAPEVDWAVAGSALVLMAGALAILRSKRRG